MNRPLLPVVLVYAAGVGLASCLALPVGWLLGAALVLAAAWFVLDRLRTWFFWTLVLFAGATTFSVQTAVLSPHDLRVIVGEDPQLVALRGRLAVTPSVRVFADDAGAVTERTVAEIVVEELRGAGAARPARGRVLVTTKGTLGAEFFAGQPVVVDGLLQRPRQALAEGLFDYRQHLRWQGIHYQLLVDRPTDWALVNSGGGPPSRPWADSFLAWAQRTLARGLPEDEPVRLLWAMVLGWRTALTNEVSAPFMRTGTMHIFAISGLHIALITGILVSLLRVLQVPRRGCGLVVLPLIWAYTAATGWQASAVRATVMMSVVVAGWSLHRPSDLLNSLAAAALIILLADPSQLFQAGFQLSFCVVLSLALVLPWLVVLRDRLFQSDPFLPSELLPRWRRWVDPPARWLAVNFAVSLAAWLGSLALVAHYFHLVTPVGLLANLVIVPMSGLALMCSLGSLFCGTWLPVVGTWFNNAAWFWMSGMVWFCERAAEWPGAWFRVRGPGSGDFVLGALLFIGLGSGWLLAPTRRRWLGVVSLMTLAWFGGEWLVLRRRAEVVVLPLPSAGAIWVAPTGPLPGLLVDGGDATAARGLVTPFLQAQGVNRLGAWVVTHGDAGHVGGWKTVMEEFDPRRVFTGEHRFRSPEYRRLLDELAGHPTRWKQWRAGDHWGGWQVLFPPAEFHLPLADENALVLGGEIEGVRVLLLSDLAPGGQAALVRSGRDLRADVVVTGLPVTGEPLAAPLLAAVQPGLILLGDAAWPLSARAGGALRQRLAASGARLFCTSDTRAVTLALRKGGWRVRNPDGVLAEGVRVTR